SNAHTTAPAATIRNRFCCICCFVRCLALVACSWLLAVSAGISVRVLGPSAECSSTISKSRLPFRPSLSFISPLLSLPLQKLWVPGRGGPLLPPAQPGATIVL